MYDDCLLCEKYVCIVADAGVIIVDCPSCGLYTMEPAALVYLERALQYSREQGRSLRERVRSLIGEHEEPLSLAAIGALATRLFPADPHRGRYAPTAGAPLSIVRTSPAG